MAESVIKDFVTLLSLACAGCGLLGRERIARLDESVRTRVSLVPVVGQASIRRLKQVLAGVLVILAVLALAVPPMLAIGALFPGGRHSMVFYGEDSLYQGYRSGWVAVVDAANRFSFGFLSGPGARTVEGMDHIRANKDFYHSLSRVFLAVCILSVLLGFISNILGWVIFGVSASIVFVAWLPYTFPLAVFSLIALTILMVYISAFVVGSLMASIALTFVATLLLRAALWPYQVVDRFVVERQLDSTVRVFLWAIAGALFVTQLVIF